MPKVAVVMGSKSDFETIKPCILTLKKWGIETEVRVLSAHRTPTQAHEFASTAKSRGVEVLIAAAGKAAHLGGVLAACTTLPIIGIPVRGTDTASFDSLLSMVQMPSGVPVAVVAVNGAENAALLAIQMLALKYPELDKKMEAYKRTMEETVLEADAQLQKELAAL